MKNTYSSLIVTLIKLIAFTKNTTPRLVAVIRNVVTSTQQNIK